MHCIRHKNWAFQNWLEKLSDFVKNSNKVCSSMNRLLRYDLFSIIQCQMKAIIEAHYLFPTHVMGDLGQFYSRLNDIDISEAQARGLPLKPMRRYAKMSINSLKSVLTTSMQRIVVQLLWRFVCRLRRLHFNSFRYCLGNWKDWKTSWLWSNVWCKSSHRTQTKGSEKPI